jgi:hypothetical protein
MQYPITAKYSEMMQYPITAKYSEMTQYPITAKYSEMMQYHLLSCGFILDEMKKKWNHQSTGPKISKKNMNYWGKK